MPVADYAHNTWLMKLRPMVNRLASLCHLPNHLSSLKTRMLILLWLAQGLELLHSVHSWNSVYSMVAKVRTGSSSATNRQKLNSITKNKSKDGWTQVVCIGLRQRGLETKKRRFMFNIVSKNTEKRSGNGLKTEPTSTFAVIKPTWQRMFTVH